MSTTNNTDNEPSHEKQVKQLQAVREITDRHCFPSAMHKHSAGALSLIVYPILEPVPGVASNNDGYQDNIDRLAGIDIGFWFSYSNPRDQVFKIWTHDAHGLPPMAEPKTAEEAAALVISKLVAAGDNQIPVIDKDKPDRKQIIWHYPPNAGGTNRFAVWHIGSGRITLYAPEGMEIERYEIKNIRTLNHVQARRIARQLWGKPTDEQWSAGLYE